MPPNIMPYDCIGSKEDERKWGYQFESNGRVQDVFHHVNYAVKADPPNESLAMQPIMQPNSSFAFPLCEDDYGESFMTAQIFEGLNIMAERMFGSPSPSVASDEDFDAFEHTPISSPPLTFDEDWGSFSPEIPVRVQSADLGGPLITSDQIKDSDVLCGRGGANTHPGNIAFRSLIGLYQHAYLTAKGGEKTKIAEEILSKINEKRGRFLQRAGSFWVDIGARAASGKIRQALRERESSDIADSLAKSNEKCISLDDTNDPVAPKTESSSFDGIFVNDNDVLLGRERDDINDSHAGNKKYRLVIRQNEQAYKACPKLEKAKIAMFIVKVIKSSGGRFLRIKGGSWVEVTDDKAREKIGQALRGKSSQPRRLSQSTQARIS